MSDMFVNFLVEDASGKKMLELLLPKIVPPGSDGMYKVYSYRGVGHLPVRGTVSPKAVKSRALLDNLPKLIGGFGKVAAKSRFPMSIVIVCDLDKKDKRAFLEELRELISSIASPPLTKFCLAIEEGEAWLLGDFTAIRTAFPHCKMDVLRKYRNDSICDTWELLADAVEPGGSTVLRGGGYQVIGAAKCKWAEMVTPYLDVNVNKSPSFQFFVTTVNQLFLAVEV